jgi:hypothetical protein
LLKVKVISTGANSAPAEQWNNNYLAAFTGVLLEADMGYLLED